MEIAVKKSYYEYQQVLMEIFINQSKRMNESSVTIDDFDDTFQPMFEAIQYANRINTPAYKFIPNHIQDEGILFQFNECRKGRAHSLDITYIEMVIGEMRRQRTFEKVRSYFEEHAHLMNIGALDYDDIASMMNKLQEISTVSNTKTRTMAEIVEEAEMKAIERTSDLHGPSTGFENMDKVLSGWETERICVIAAPPHTGKSMVVYNIIKEAATKMPVTIFGLETPTDEIQYKTQSIISGIDYDKAFKRSNANEKEKAVLHLTAERMKKFNMNNFGVNSNITHIEDMREIIHNTYHKNGGVQQMVIIDHIGLVTTKERFNSTNERLAHISNELLRIRGQYNCTIIVLTQLNKEGLRSRRNPDLSHIKDNSTLAENADLLMFVYREDKADNDVDNDESKHTVVPLALIVKKNRSTGRMGVIKFRAELMKQRLVPIDDKEYAELVELVKVKDTHH